MDRQQRGASRTRMNGGCVDDGWRRRMTHATTTTNATNYIRPSGRATSLGIRRGVTTTSVLDDDECEETRDVGPKIQRRLDDKETEDGDGGARASTRRKRGGGDGKDVPGRSIGEGGATVRRNVRSMVGRAPSRLASRVPTRRAGSGSTTTTTTVMNRPRDSSGKRITITNNNTTSGGRSVPMLTSTTTPAYEMTLAREMDAGDAESLDCAVTRAYQGLVSDYPRAERTLRMIQKYQEDRLKRLLCYERDADALQEERDALKSAYELVVCERDEANSIRERARNAESDANRRLKAIKMQYDKAKEESKRLAVIISRAHAGDISMDELGDVARAALG